LTLKLKAISGIKWTTFSTVVSTTLELIQLAILARFLDPSAFGLMALVRMVVGFSQAFLDMGISNAIIHKQEITKDQLSTLYWVNVLAGFILFVIVALIAPVISEFYNEPELTNLILVASLAFLIQPFGQQFMILWQKEMRFSEMAKIDIANKFVSLLVSVYLAYKGHGVYALVYGVLAGMITQTAMFLYVGLKEYKPSFVFKMSEIKEFLSFGAYQMGEKSINYFTGQADTIIIGKLLGMEALGLYNLIKQIIEKSIYVLNNIVNKVTFPVFSKVQNNNDELKNTYIKVLNILTFIQFPILVTQYFYGYEILVMVLGDKWIGTEPLVKLFAIYSLFLVYGNPVGSLILAKGKANWSFYTNVIYAVLYTSSIYIFVKYYGLNGALYGYIFISFISFYPYWKLLISKLIDVKFIEYYSNFIKQLAISSMSGYIGYVVSNQYFNNIIANIGIYMLIILPIFAVLNYIFNKEILNILKKLRG
jgi:O-antigen/teichoic acid export membrane protein